MAIAEDEHAVEKVRLGPENSKCVAIAEAALLYIHMSTV